MQFSIKKAVIPVAGNGTRLYPYSKYVPKEMMPIVDKPVIKYLVEEAVSSGIEKIIFIISEKKHLLREYLESLPDLQAELIFILQDGRYGTATPVLNAEKEIDNEPFAILYADELFFHTKPRLLQLIETFQVVGHPILGAIQTDDAGTRRYGIILPGETADANAVEVKGFHEKPGPQVRSRLASIGSYVMTPDIFDAIRRVHPQGNDEYKLTDGFSELMKQRPFYALELAGEYNDTGNKAGWLKTNLAAGLRHPETHDEIKNFLTQNPGF
ncbi:hypothetical protein KKD88_01695 [Patescibacteria group bacterium]|nr:hypothetical protein [Patescibacteria group bacterium]